MPYTKDNMIGTGSFIELAAVAFGATAPAQHVLTVGTAGTIGDTTISLSADVEMYIRDGHRIDFADGSYAIVSLPLISNDDGFTIPDTGPVLVPCEPLTSAVTIGTTSVTKYRDMGFETKAIADLPYIFPYRLLQGPTEISVTPTTETVDGTDLNSKLGKNTIIVGVGVEATVQVNRMYKDRAYREVIDPIVHDLHGKDARRLVWMRVTEADGTVYEGPCRPQLTGSSNAGRQLKTASLTLSIEGDSYSYIPSELSLFNMT